MAHINLPEGAPGIIGPMLFRPETAEHRNGLAEVLLRGPSTLSRGERELIAASVSRLNECKFCCTSHSTFAALQLDDGWGTVDATLADRESAPVSAKLKALLAIAAKVQRSGREVTDADVEAARAEGASDVEIHDTVLIAAAFCMYNRYVDGLGTWAPPNREDYEEMGRAIVEHGYLAAVGEP